MAYKKNKKCDVCHNFFNSNNKKNTCNNCENVQLSASKKLSINENFTLHKKEVIILLELLECETAINFDMLTKKTKIPQSTTYRHLSNLIDYLLVEKIDSLFQLSRKGRKIILKLIGWNLQHFFQKNNEKRKIRFHALQGKFNLIKPINNYKNYLHKYQTFPVGRSKTKRGFKVEFDKVIITISSPKTIVVSFPEFMMPFEKSEEFHKIYGDIGIIIDLLASKLQIMFPGLEIDSFQPFQLTKQEIAIVNSKFTIKYLEINKGHLNQERIITDYSKGLPELEVVNLTYATQDFQKCIRMENNLNVENYSLSVTESNSLCEENLQKFQNPNLVHSNFVSYPENYLSPPTGI